MQFMVLENTSVACTDVRFHHLHHIGGAKFSPMMPTVKGELQPDPAKGVMLKTCGIWTYSNVRLPKKLMPLNVIWTVMKPKQSSAVDTFVEEMPGKIASWQDGEVH